MKKLPHLLLLCFFYVFSQSPVFASILFGPEQYIRENDPGTSYTNTFPAHSGDALLVVERGQNHRSKNDFPAITAHITLNGQQILSPGDFKQQVLMLHKPVNLLENNTLSITLHGKPGTFLTVRIERPNAPPEAIPQSVFLNEDSHLPLTLTGTDIDGDSLSFLVSAAPNHGTLTGEAPYLLYTPDLNYYGEDSFSFLVNDGQRDSENAMVSITILPVNDTPVANAGPDEEIIVGETVLLSGNASFDIDGTITSYEWLLMDSPNGSLSTIENTFVQETAFTPDKKGEYTVELTVTDNEGASDSAILHITAMPVMVAVPDVTHVSLQDAQEILIEASLDLGQTSFIFDKAVLKDTVISQDPPANQLIEEGTPVNLILSAGPESTGPSVSFSTSLFTIAAGQATTLLWDTRNAGIIYIDNGIGHVSTQGEIIVRPTHTTTYTLTATGTQGSINSSVTIFVFGHPAPPAEGTFGSQYKDIIPSDATIESYDEKRFSIITGLVFDETNSPLANVSVTIHSHPALGTATTDDNGHFSIPVEGGGLLTLVYEEDGHLTSHRQIDVPWNAIATAPTIQMLPEDTLSTIIEFDGNPTTIVPHTGSETYDEFGSRSATLIFTGDNRPFFVDEQDNIIHELPAITVRATEYTNFNSMPAKLPANSAYTYCVELQVDGIKRVRFEKPVPLWLDNFLGFEIGEKVPLGYYDRDQALWIAADNGVVVRLLDLDNDGTVDALDTTGDWQANDLNHNGSFTDEVAGLTDTLRFQPGESYWRMEVSHFTPWDGNWPYAPPADSQPPLVPDPDPKPDIPPEDPCTNSASYVKHKTQAFHEDIPLPGTDFTLHYTSNRVPGYLRKISVPVSGKEIPASLKEIIVKFEIAGQIFSQILPAAPDQVIEFIWNGKDFLDQAVTGSINGKVSIGYVYDAVYVSAGNFARSFAQAGSEVTRIKARQEVISWKHSLVNFSQSLSSAGKNQLATGWSLSSHHSPDYLFRSILKGDGTTTENTMFGYIKPIAGGGSSVDDDQHALDTAISPRDIKIAGDGAVYFVDGPRKIRRINTDETISSIVSIASGYIMSLALGPDDSVYFLKTNCFGCTGAVIQHLNKEEELETIASFPNYDSTAIAVGSDNAVYITHEAAKKIDKILPDGTISEIARVSHWPWGITIHPDGSVYIATTYDDTIDIIPPYGDRTSIPAHCPIRTDWDPTGTMYIAGSNYYYAENGVYQYTTSGIMKRISGPQGSPDPQEGALLRDVWFPARYLCYSHKHNGLLISYQEKIWLVSINAPEGVTMHDGEILVPEDQDLAYIFTKELYHRQTINFHTGMPYLSFDYDTENRLTTITDRFGNITSVERDSNGTPTAILSPYGHRTELAINADKNLTAVSYEDGTGYAFDYSSGGLMTSMTDQRNFLSSHNFDETGRVTSTHDPEDGIWIINNQSYADGSRLSSITSSEENTISHFDTTAPDNTYQTLTTYPCGTTKFFTQESGGFMDSLEECGMKTSTRFTVDAWSKQKRPHHITISTPSGLAKEINIEQTYTEAENGFTETATTTLTQNNKTTRTETDFQAGTTIQTSPEQRAVITTFDPQTLLTTDVSKMGLLPTRFYYDTEGRLTRVETGERVTSYTYDSRGNTASTTDPVGQTVRYEYDLLNRPTLIERQDGSLVRFDYDETGNMVLLTTPTPADNIFAYNGINKPSSYTTPLANTTSYSYDKERKLTEISLPSGKSIFNTYLHGRLSQTSTAEWTNLYTYDCRNKIKAITRGEEKISNLYDGDLLTTANLSGTVNSVLNYSFNNDFSLSSFTYSGATENISYDDDGLITAIGRFSITRNPDNGLPESVSDSLFSLYRSYNGYGEQATHHSAVNGIDFLSWHLSRDPIGRIIEKQETIHETPKQYSYTYDSIGQLLSVSINGSLTEHYQYDNNGNRIYEMNTLRSIAGRSLTYSLEDHLITAGNVTYEYDFDDNLARKRNGTAMTEYDYSSRGELLKVTLPDSQEIEYIHDPLGRPIGKKINGALTRKFLWQGMTQLLAVYDGNDNLLMRFEYADDRVPYAMTSGGSTFYLAYDQVGSLRGITDINGNLVKRLDYDAFGNIIVDTNPNFAVPIGFAGGLYDPDTGLVRFGLRDYCPEIGRWTSKDPILFDGGSTNLFGYVQNDPVNLVDPLGLRWFGGGDDGWSLGRPGTIIPPGGTVGAALETYGPAMETMSKIHDPLVGALVPELGDGKIATAIEKAVDRTVNVPSMPAAYTAAVAYETANSVVNAVTGIFNFLTGPGSCDNK